MFVCAQALLTSLFGRHKEQVLEWCDDVLGFAKTNIHFQEREFDQKLANGHAELVFWKKCRIIWNKTNHSLLSKV